MKPRQLQGKRSAGGAEGGSVQPPTEAPSALSPHRVFVVQFRAETDIEQGHYTGRVEHVVSGQATRFASLEELLAFIAQVLAAIRAPPRRKPRSSRQGAGQ
jgi:hypothetical protein